MASREATGLRLAAGGEIAPSPAEGILEAPTERGVCNFGALTRETAMDKGSHTDPMNHTRTEHAWWRRQAGEIASIATQTEGSRAKWLHDRNGSAGVPWDGRSELPVGDGVLKGSDLQQFVAHLKPAIESLSPSRVAAPTSRDVRVAVVGLEQLMTLVIDVDFHDFLLPLAIRTNRSVGGPRALISNVKEILGHIEAAERVRGIVSRREATLRRAVEDISARIDGGCIPLWLRMDPISVTEAPPHLSSRHYRMVTTLIDDSLSSSASPPEPIWTVADIRDHQRLHGRSQKRRMAALSALQQSGSVGTMTEISSALLRAANLEPLAALETARAARVEDRHGDLRFRRWSCLNILTWIEGVLRTSIEFKGGWYSDGQLTLHGNYPASLAAAATGRPLASIMDHPAFRTSGVKIANATTDDDALNLFHADRLILSDGSMASVARKRTAQQTR